MLDAISKALADADGSYARATKAVASRGARALTSSPGGFYSAPSSLSKSAEQYRHYNAWSFCAIRAISQRIAGQSVFAAVAGAAPSGKKRPRFIKGMGDGLEPLESHPLLDAINNPNELMVRWSLMVSTVASLELTGRSFWWMPQEKGRIEIWPLPVNWVSAADPMRGSWIIKPKGAPEGFEVPSEEVAYYYLPDPSDPFGATSPLQTQAPAVATDEQIQVAQFRQFRNGITPGLIFKVGRLSNMAGTGEGPRPVLTDAQKRQLVDAIKKSHQGAQNYNEPLVIDGSVESVTPYTTAPKEMDFLDSGKTVKSRILQAYGVNPLILGEIEGANRAQAVVAEESFAANTCNPLIEMMSQVMTEWVGPRFASKGEKLTVWIDPVVARDVDVELKTWEMALRYGAANLNEFRVRMLNLPESTAFAGGPDMFNQMARNYLARTRVPLDEVGAQDAGPIESWQWDRQAVGNGNGKVRV